MRSNIAAALAAVDRFLSVASNPMLPHSQPRGSHGRPYSKPGAGKRRGPGSFERPYRKSSYLRGLYSDPTANKRGARMERAAAAEAIRRAHRWCHLPQRGDTSFFAKVKREVAVMAEFRATGRTKTKKARRLWLR